MLGSRNDSAPAKVTGFVPVLEGLRFEAGRFSCTCESPASSR
jgi:hypothetical protein